MIALSFTLCLTEHLTLVPYFHSWTPYSLKQIYGQYVVAKSWSPFLINFLCRSVLQSKKSPTALKNVSITIDNFWQQTKNRTKVKLEFIKLSFRLWNLALLHQFHESGAKQLFYCQFEIFIKICGKAEYFGGSKLLSETVVSNCR